VTSESLAQVVGRNCRRVRTLIGLTQDEFARYAQASGLRWNAAKVGNFEAGRSAPTLATVLIVGDVLAWATAVARFEKETGYSDRPGLPDSITLADLFAGGDGLVTLADGRTVRAEDLIAVARGGPFQSWGNEEVSPTERSGLTEHRLAKGLNISSARLADISNKLWQKTFSAERDRRAGPDASQQKRGRISREMRAEIERELADGDD
jgi:transcriptional regulator with XRE-family HTH domain